MFEIQRRGSYSTLNDFVDVLRAFQLQDMDALVGITSFKGLGKTTLGAQIGIHHHKKYMDKPFSFERNMAYDNDDVKKKINELPHYSALLCDEAVRFALGEDWGKGESKDLKKLFTQIRTKHLLIIFCLPDLWWTDRKYREGMMAFWLHVLTRSRAALFAPDLRPGIDDRWGKRELHEKIKPYNWFTANEKIEREFKKLRACIDIMAFPKIPQEQYERYLKIRDSHVYEDYTVQGKGSSTAQKLPAWNFYNRFWEILDALKRKNVKFNNDEFFKRPSADFIARELFYSPTLKQQIVEPRTINKWINQIKENIPTEF